MKSAKFMLLAFACFAVAVSINAEEEPEDDPSTGEYPWEEYTKLEGGKLKVCRKDGPEDPPKCREANDGGVLANDQDGGAEKFEADFTQSCNMGRLRVRSRVSTSYSNDTYCPDKTISDKDKCCPTCYYKGRIPRGFKVRYLGITRTCYIDYKQWKYNMFRVHGICREPDVSCDEKGVVPADTGAKKYKYYCKQLYLNEVMPCRFYVKEANAYIKTHRRYRWPSQCSCRPILIDNPPAADPAADAAPAQTGPN